MGIIINPYLADPKSRGCSGSFIPIITMVLASWTLIPYLRAMENPAFWWYLPGKMGIFMGELLVSGRVIIIRIPMKQPVLPPWDSTCNRWIWRLAWKKLSKPGSSDFRSHGSHGSHEVRGHPVFFFNGRKCMYNIIYIYIKHMIQYMFHWSVFF